MGTRPCARDPEDVRGGAGDGAETALRAGRGPLRAAAHGSVVARTARWDLRRRGECGCMRDHGAGLTDVAATGLVGQPLRADTQRGGLSEALCARNQAIPSSCRRAGDVGRGAWRLGRSGRKAQGGDGGGRKTTKGGRTHRGRRGAARRRGGVADRVHRERAQRMQLRRRATSVSRECQQSPASGSRVTREYGQYLSTVRVVEYTQCQQRVSVVSPGSTPGVKYTP